MKNETLNYNPENQSVPTRLENKRAIQNLPFEFLKTVEKAPRLEDLSDEDLAGYRTDLEERHAKWEEQRAYGSQSETPIQTPTPEFAPVSPEPTPTPAPESAGPIMPEPTPDPIAQESDPAVIEAEPVDPAPEVVEVEPITVAPADLEPTTAQPETAPEPNRKQKVKRKIGRMTTAVAGIVLAAAGAAFLFMSGTGTPTQPSSNENNNTPPEPPRNPGFYEVDSSHEFRLSETNYDGLFLDQDGVGQYVFNPDKQSYVQDPVTGEYALESGTDWHYDIAPRPYDKEILRYETGDPNAELDARIGLLDRLCRQPEAAALSMSQMGDAYKDLMGVGSINSFKGMEAALEDPATLAQSREGLKTILENATGRFTTISGYAYQCYLSPTNPDNIQNNSESITGAYTAPRQYENLEVFEVTLEDGTVLYYNVDCDNLVVLVEVGSPAPDLELIAPTPQTPENTPSSSSPETSSSSTPTESTPNHDPTPDPEPPVVSEPLEEKSESEILAVQTPDADSDYNSVSSAPAREVTERPAASSTPEPAPAPSSSTPASSSESTPPADQTLVGDQNVNPAPTPPPAPESTPTSTSDMTDAEQGDWFNQQFGSGA